MELMVDRLDTTTMRLGGALERVSDDADADTRASANSTGGSRHGSSDK